MSMPPSFEIATSLEASLQTREVIERRIGHNLLLLVQTPCMGRALKTIWDIETALEYGAVPAAQLAMLCAVRNAENSNTPLRISLGYDAV